jgi:hypothetical protein
MALATKAVANQLVSILTGLSGMGTVQIGAPESFSQRVGAYVTMGSHSLSRHATGVMRRQTRYLVVFVYRLDGAEATAETALMDLVDAFLAAIHADLTLGGNCKAVEIDVGLADLPEYQLRAGKEFREYPIIVIATQDGSYTVNP